MTFSWSQSHWTSCDIRTYTPCSVHLLLSIYKKPCVRQSLNSVLSYLSSVSQHWVFGFGQLLSTDDLQHQLFLHLTRHRVLQVWVKGTCRRKKYKWNPPKCHTHNKRVEWKVCEATKWLHYPSKGKDWNSSLVYEAIMVMVEYTSLRIRYYFICLTS